MAKTSTPPPMVGSSPSRDDLRKRFIRALAKLTPEQLEAAIAKGRELIAHHEGGGNV